MTGPARRSSRSTLSAVALALAALASAQAPAASQSPSVPPASAGPGASPPVASTPVASAAPVDVAAIRWKQSRKSKGFGPRDGSPVAFDMTVGPTGRFLMVGVDKDRTPSRRAVIFGSDDGVKWTKLKGKIPKGSAAAGVVTTDDGFLIVGDMNSTGPLVLTSDGTTVTALDAPEAGLPTGKLYSVANTPVGLVAAGTDATGLVPTMWTSADGITWTGTALSDASFVIHVAVDDAGTIVALGALEEDYIRTPIAWTSTDGTTWTRTLLPVEPGNWSMPDLEATPLGFVAPMRGQEGGQVFLSPDGVTWTPVLQVPDFATVGSAGTEAILFGEDTWWHSPDGATWTTVATKAFDGYHIETSAVRPDGAVIAGGYMLGDFMAVEPLDSIRTWVGRAPTSSPAAPG